MPPRDRYFSDWIELAEAHDENYESYEYGALPDYDNDEGYDYDLPLIDDDYDG